MAKKRTSSVFCPPDKEALYGWSVHVSGFAISKTLFSDPQVFSTRRDNCLALLAKHDVVALRDVSERFRALLTKYDYATGTPQEQKAILAAWQELRSEFGKYTDTIEREYPSLKSRMEISIPRQADFEY